MFDVGFWELSLIFIIALVVLGPERLPRVARDVGLWVGRLRRYVANVREDIEREVHAQELRELVNRPRELDGLNDLKDVVSETKASLDEAKRTLGEAEREAAAGDDAPAKGVDGNPRLASTGDESVAGEQQAPGLAAAAGERRAEVPMADAPQAEPLQAEAPSQAEQPPQAVEQAAGVVQPQAEQPQAEKTP